MSKTQLQSNNTRLASLIDELKGKATGGGETAPTYETCIVNLGSSMDQEGQVIYYTLSNGIPAITSSYFPVLKVVSQLVPSGIEVIKGSELIFGCGSIANTSVSLSISGEIACLEGEPNTQLGYQSGMRFKVNGPGTIIYN